MNIRRIIEIEEKDYEAACKVTISLDGAMSIYHAIRESKPYEERPQGEWIKEPNGKTTDIYRCSICGRSVLLCKNADLSKYPFCHCGADMRGGMS